MSEEYEVDNMEPDLGEGSDGFGSDPILEESYEPETFQEDDEPQSEHSDKKSETTNEPKKIDRSKYNKLRRQAYELEHEKQQLLEELNRVKASSEQSNQAALTHYDVSVKLKLEQAKQRLTKAIEDGDVQEQTNAADDLAAARAEMQQINSWQMQQKYQEENRRQQPAEREAPYRQPEPEIQEELQSWVSENPWFDPQSEEYDSDMAEEVQAFATAYEKQLARSGQRKKIGSEDYFDHINKYVRQNFYGEEPEQPASRNLNMKQVRQNVAPVGGGVAKSKMQHGKKELTAGEKEVAKMMRITEDQYRDSKKRVEEQRRQSGRTN